MFKYYIQYFSARYRLVTFKEHGAYFKSVDFTPCTQNLILDTYDMRHFKQQMSEELTKEEYDFLYNYTMTEATRPMTIER